jgi:hypothetical protein
MLDSSECRALLAECRLGDHDGRPAETFPTPNEEQMDSTPFGDAKPAPAAELAAPRNIKMDRGNGGRVRMDGRA